MAAPIYDTAANSAHDLTDINLCEVSTGFSQYTSTGGNLAIGAGVDFSLQGTNGVDAKITNNEKGYAYNNGSGITLGAGDHIYMWLYQGTPGLTDTLALRGMTVALGTGTTAWVKYHVEGNNTYGAQGRVGKCYVVDYSTRSTNTGSVPYRSINGTAGANPQYFGMSCNITAAVKSNNVCIDAIRYGTGAYIYNGEVADPCTFSDFSTVNDAVANRWGILIGTGGSNYELQGKFAIGQNNAGTATQAYFDDSDINISVVDTVHSASTFSEIIIDQASTTCLWTNISITALGTNNPGAITVNSANPTFTVEGGTFTDIGDTQLRSNSTMTGVTWRRCGQITQSAATLTSCTIEASSNSTAFVSTPTTIDEVTDTTFISDGTGHAVDLGAINTTAGDVTITWDNFLDDGAGTEWTGTAGTVSSGGSTNSALVFTYTGANDIIIDVQAGATVPTVRWTGTGSGVVDVQAGNVTTKVTVQDIANAATKLQNARVLLEADTGGALPVGTDIISGTTNVSGEITDIRSFSGNQPVTGKVRRATAANGDYYKPTTFSGTISSTTGADFTVSLIKDE